MRLTKNFSRPAFNRLTLAVLLALSGNALATVDYSGVVTGNNQPASGSQDWLDAEHIRMGYLGSSPADSSLSITGGSIVSAQYLTAFSDAFSQRLIVSGAGSQLNIDSNGASGYMMLLGRGSHALFENGAQVKLDSGTTGSGLYIRDGASLIVTGAGTRLSLEGDASTQTMELADGRVSLSDGAVVSLNEIIMTHSDSVFNIGGEQGGGQGAWRP